MIKIFSNTLACWLEFTPGPSVCVLERLVTHMSALSGIPVCDDKMLDVNSEEVAFAVLLVDIV